jgi:hypothetical protein
MKMRAFWDTALCGIFSEVLAASIDLILEAVSISETSVYFCETVLLNVSQKAVIFKLFVLTFISLVGLPTSYKPYL